MSTMQIIGFITAMDIRIIVIVDVSMNLKWITRHRVRYNIKISIVR